MHGRAVLTALLAGALRRWGREHPARHAAAVLVLVLVLAVRFLAAVASPEPIEDERVYFAAFELAGRGESPYQLSYFYTPTLALLGAWALEHLGEPWLLAALRFSNLLGTAVIAWCALAWMPWTWRRRLLVAALYVCLAPAVRMGVLWGNLSLAAIGLLTLGLFLWRSRPILAGALLAASVIVKPIGPVAVLLLMAHRPSEAGRRHLVAGGMALILAAGLLLPMPYFEDMLSLDDGRPPPWRSVALHHVLYCFGLELRFSLVAAVIAAASVFVARRRRLGPARFYCFAASATLLATPMVWNHTMLLALPLQALALAVAHARNEARLADSGTGRRYEAVGVVLLVLAIQLCGAMGGVMTWPPLLQGVIKALPCLAPAVLTVYLFRSTDPF
jgi:hypothetical protein